MSAALANVIKKRSRSYVVTRRSAVTTNPQTGRGVEASSIGGTLRCHIQGFDGPRRVDGVAGVDTAGLIKIWVPSDVTIVLDDASDGGDLHTDGGQGSTDAPGDVIEYDGHSWLVIERQRWAEDGTHQQYLARDEGAL